MRTFTWWDSEDIAVLDKHVANWRLSFPDHRVLGPAEAREALSLLDHDAVSLFDRIRIPACRSDLARLALLLRDGGLYVDAHCRVETCPETHEFVDQIANVELVIFTKWAPFYRRNMPFNGVIAAKSGSELIQKILYRALDNISIQEQLEREQGFTPYHVWALTGPGVIWNTVFDTSSNSGQILPEYQDRVQTIPPDFNLIQRHIFTQYRGPGTHWSERQKHEALFHATNY